VTSEDSTFSSSCRHWNNDDRYRSVGRERIENHDGVLMRINKGLSDLIFQFGKGIKNISFFNLRRRVCCRASQFVASVKIMLHPLFLQSIPMT
jgi:hypothetical protein